MSKEISSLIEGSATSLGLQQKKKSLERQHLNKDICFPGKGILLEPFLLPHLCWKQRAAEIGWIARAIGKLTFIVESSAPPCALKKTRNRSRLGGVEGPKNRNDRHRGHLPAR